MKQKKMNALLRVLFIVLIIAIFGAAILQIFAPEYMGRSAAYGIAKGWLVLCQDLVQIKMRGSTS